MTSKYYVEYDEVNKTWDVYEVDDSTYEGYDYWLVGFRYKEDAEEFCKEQNQKYALKNLAELGQEYENSNS